MREKLVELLKQANDNAVREIQIRRLEATEHIAYGMIADYLLDNGVVVFVNCNQCEYFNTGGFSNGTGWCEKHEHGQSEDGYCSDALNKIQYMMK